jgi:MATE family multidrug resistance protein
MNKTKEPKIFKGESYTQLLSYWIPEVISAAVLTTLPLLFDAYVIANLNSTSTYGALGVANNFLHLLMKLAESISVATTTIVGRFNGAKEYDKAGESFGDSFWSTFFLGIIVSAFIFIFSYDIYLWLGVPQHMANIGTSFLKLRALSLLFLFINLAFFGFMRGVKNTKTPMIINVIGTVVFMVLDYILVLGKFGAPQLKLNGSAIAGLVQYVLMAILCIFHVLGNEKYKAYFSKAFFSLFTLVGAFRIIKITIPIMIDKVSLASSYVVLNKLINPMGKYATAAYVAVKDLERLAFLPAIAFATVITFLVSNRLGQNDPEGARANIRRVLLLAGSMVFILLFLLCINPAFFVQIFDPRKKFIGFAAQVFPWISVLVICDFVQLILAGVLRGAGDVRAVMIIRALCCYAFFAPFATWIASLPIKDDVTKFILIYGSFYVNAGLMGILFIIRLKSKRLSTTRI